MKFVKENLNLILCLIIFCILTGIMFYFIDKKEGFHEDEIFSYGASNSKFCSTFLSYRQVDNLDTVMKDKSVINTLKKFIFYKLNPKEYEKVENDMGLTNSNSIWRNKEDAIEYMKIDTINEALDFFTVYWNTGRDVHPPLFYFLVHIVSIFFYNTFSKYIIFIINLVFFLATCVIIKKILKKIDKDYLSVPTLILYGMSIGAISTVMFQRMYAMLTFFTVYFLYINLKVYFNNFKLDKKLKIELCIVTILGFLTQYYFCIYAVFVALVMIIIMLKCKYKEYIKIYFMQFVKSAVVGVLIFLPSIYHIFFSYRGAGSSGNEYTFVENLLEFIKNTFLAFSLANVLGVGITIIIIVSLIYNFRKSDRKALLCILIIPIILNFICIVKMSPYRSLRYVMNILPIISLVVILIIESIFKNKKLSVCILSVFAISLSMYGLATNNVKYLYLGYNDFIKVAEENKDSRYVLVCQTVFNHIQNVPEMMIYKESMIVEPEKLNLLKDNKEIIEDEEFILSIKTWLGNTDEILEEVLQNTGFTNYELLLDSPKKAANCRIYRISK